MNSSYSYRVEQAEFISIWRGLPSIALAIEVIVTRIRGIKGIAFILKGTVNDP